MSDYFRLGIIVPYKDRKEHLSIFLQHSKKFFENRNYTHKIYIIEQSDSKEFNRGKLLNIGFDLSKNENDYLCFHDVDMLPISESCDYSYTERPMHLAEKVEQFGWKLPYPDYFGGVLLCDKGSFSAANGYYNDFWGWGCEDDDLLNRFKKNKINFGRRSGEYKSLSHEPNGDVTWINGAMVGIRGRKCVLDNRKKMSEMKEEDYANNGLNNLEYKIQNHKYVDKNVILVEAKL